MSKFLVLIELGYAFFLLIEDSTGERVCCSPRRLNAAAVIKSKDSRGAVHEDVHETIGAETGAGNGHGVSDNEGAELAESEKVRAMKDKANVISIGIESARYGGYDEKDAREVAMSIQADKRNDTEDMKMNMNMNMVKHKKRKTGAEMSIDVNTEQDSVISNGSGKMETTRNEDHANITKGDPVDISEMPYLAIVKITKHGGRGHCTSSILTTQWVLSAAHCFPGVKPHMVQIIAGQTHMDRPQQSSQTRNGKKLIIHPDHLKQTSPGNSDIALIYVDEEFIFNVYVAAIRMRSQEWPQPSQKMNCIAAGWGRYHFYERETGPLQYIKTVAAHGSNSCPCVKKSSKKNIVCLEKSDGKGICKGDSGGPLVCDNEVVGVAHILHPSPFLCISIFAGQPECGASGWIDVYMYTCPYLSWIHSYVSEVPPQPQSCKSPQSKPIAMRYLLISVVFIYITCVTKL